MYIEIPNNVKPYWSATINNKTYTYPAGTLQNVPEEVFNLIYNLQLSEEQHVSYSEQASDWNQNNPTATDYIKNRTHWVETGNVVFAQDVTEDFKAGAGMPIPAEIELVAGRKYEVIWDGKPYSCVAYLLEFEGQSFTVLGNASVGDPTFSGGNGEPFLLNAVPGMTLVLAEVPGKHTYTISGEKEIIHGLDAKYIELTSPNGTKFTLNVDDDGRLYAYSPNSGGPV